MISTASGTSRKWNVYLVKGGVLYNITYECICFLPFTRAYAAATLHNAAHTRQPQPTRPPNAVKIRRVCEYTRFHANSSARIYPCTETHTRINAYLRRLTHNHLQLNDFTGDGIFRSATEAPPTPFRGGRHGHKYKFENMFDVEMYCITYYMIIFYFSGCNMLL